MKTAEKLNLMKEMEARNNDRDREFIQAQKLEALHKTAEDVAEAIHSGIDILAKHYGVEHSELFNLLIDTMQALEQIRLQEG